MPCPGEGSEEFSIVMVHRGRDQLMDILLIGGEVRRKQHHQLDGSNWSGTCVLVVSSFHLVGACFLHVKCLYVPFREKVVWLFFQVGN